MSHDDRHRATTALLLPLPFLVATFFLGLTGRRLLVRGFRVAQPLLWLPSPVLFTRELISSFETFFRSDARPRKHMRSIKAAVRFSL